MRNAGSCAGAHDAPVKARYLRLQLKRRYCISGLVLYCKAGVAGFVLCWRPQEEEN
ncbi:hypothetical protein [Methylocystis sp.]|uniref:hypothetical protein n=1 Tax=Methylocystis sp. TaxID=1911079 RepID=UPI003DA324ED